MPLYALEAAAPELADPARCFIAPGAHVIGKVVLGADVGVWFGAVLRGDNEAITIGPETNIQEQAVLHTDMGFALTIGRGCTIGHGAILHGCTLGDYVLIGMGAIILNGAVIGEGSLVGAGALVTEGKVFPPRSLIVGSPAKAIRTLDDAAYARLKASATSYMQNARRFADGLTAIPEA